MLHNDHRIPFGLAVSSGCELVTRTDEHLEHARDAGCYRVVAPVLETIRSATALAVVRELSWPVVPKSAAPGLPDEPDAGGVVTGISGPTAPRRAYRDLAARLGPVVRAAAQVEDVLDAVDANPVLAGASGCLAVGVLVAPCPWPRPCAGRPRVLQSVD